MQKLFNYLDSETGNLEIIFFYNPLEPAETKLNGLLFRLYDPIYHDRKAAAILLNLPKMSSPGEWTSNGTNAIVGKFWKER